MTSRSASPMRSAYVACTRVIRWVAANSRARAGSRAAIAATSASDDFCAGLTSASGAMRAAPSIPNLSGRLFAMPFTAGSIATRTTPDITAAAVCELHVNPARIAGNQITEVYAYDRDRIDPLRQTRRRRPGRTVRLQGRAVRGAPDWQSPMGGARKTRPVERSPRRADLRRGCSSKSNDEWRARRDGHQRQAVRRLPLSEPLDSGARRQAAAGDGLDSWRRIYHRRGLAADLRWIRSHPARRRGSRQRQLSPR